MKYMKNIAMKKNRKVEGFVLKYPNNTIEKYVRYKDGKLTEHFSN